MEILLIKRILGVIERIGEKNPCVFGLVVTINLYVLVACLKKSSFYADMLIWCRLQLNTVLVGWLKMNIGEYTHLHYFSIIIGAVHS